MNQVSTQPTTQQLITESLNTLSSDLHRQMTQTLRQMDEKQQTLIQEQIQTVAAELSTRLYQQLLTHLTEQVTKQTEKHNGQITQYLNELSKLQTAEIATLKSGREEFQSLQQKIQTALSKLESIPPADESEIATSINNLQNSVKTLQESLQQHSGEQQTLENLIAELETLKTDMTTTLSNLQQQQTKLAASLEQFQPLLKP